MSRKDADQLVKALRDEFAAQAAADEAARQEAIARGDQGADLIVVRRLDVEKRGGHWHIVTAAGQSLYSFGSTPSDARFRRNTVGELRRRGLVPHTFR